MTGQSIGDKCRPIRLGWYGMNVNRAISLSLKKYSSLVFHFIFESHVPAFFNRPNQMTLLAWPYWVDRSTATWNIASKFSITKNWLRDFIECRKATSVAPPRMRKCLWIFSEYYLLHLQTIFSVGSRVGARDWFVVLWFKFNSISQIILWHQLTRKNRIVRNKARIIFCILFELENVISIYVRESG